MIIRDVQETDVSAMLSLIQSKAEFDGCADSLVTNEAAIGDAFFSQAPKARAIVVEVDRAVVGIATYYMIYSTFIARAGLWLDDLYVDERYRALGAGRALMTRLCRIALDNDCGRIDWIVARDNDKARGFYQSLGAEIFEEIRHSRLDAVAIKTLAD